MKTMKTMKTTIAHLVNPFRVATGELRDAQELATASMVAARHRALEHGLSVELLTAQFADDHWLQAPFRATADLQRSVVDLAHFAVPRKLPLVADLIRRLVEGSDAEILVFSNVDIAVQEELYIEAVKLLASRDACSITRRTVAETLAAGADRATIARLARSEGRSHPGHDCFIVRRWLFETIDLGRMCIGFPPFGRAIVAILSSIVASPERFAILDPGLTYHVGDSKSWQNDQYHDYWMFNRAEALAAIDRNTANRGLSPIAAEIRQAIMDQAHL